MDSSCLQSPTTRICLEILIVAVVMLCNVSCQRLSRNVAVVDPGSSYNFTCPKSLPKNYRFKFFARSSGPRKEIDLGNRRFKQLGSTLQISPVTIHDSGHYFCGVIDEQGALNDSLAEIGHLIIRPVCRFPFKMSVKNHPPEEKTIRIREGESITFKCEYNCLKAPIKWSMLTRFNGTTKEITISKDIVVKSDPFKSIEMYVIKKVSKKDQGTYKCSIKVKKEKVKKEKVSNSYALQVLENSKPEFQATKDVFQLRNGGRLRVNLKLNGQPNPNITCFRAGTVLIECSGKELESKPCKDGNYAISKSGDFFVTKVLFKHHGIYRCEATNILGSANHSFTVDVLVRPKISQQSTHLWRKNLEPGLVTCWITLANPRPNITWFQQDMVNRNDDPLPSAWNGSTYDSTFTALGRARYKSILNVPWKQEETFFRCVATNKRGSGSRIYRFFRYPSGEEPLVVTPNHAVINAEETLTSECKIKSTVPGVVVFYKETSQKEIRNDTRTTLTLQQDASYRYLNMTIKNLTINDTGTYRCTEKGQETDPRVVLNLIVKELRPARIFNLRNQTAVYDEDQSVSLFCNVSGNPPPQVEWYKDGSSFGKSVLKQQNCDKLNSGYYFFEDDRYRTKLVICKPAVRHTSHYTCFAKNKLGNVNSTAFLNVFAAAAIVKPTLSVEKGLRVGKKYKITCQASGNPIPYVQWVRFDNGKNATNQSLRSSTFRIESMDESFVGNYSCITWNSYGRAKKQLLNLKLNSPGPGVINASSGGTGTGTIIGIVVGVVIFVLILVMLGFIIYRRQQRKLLFYKHQYFLKTGEYMVDPSLTLNEQSLNLPYDSDWEFPFERLVLGDRIGAGAFGEVYKAEAMGILALNARDKSSIANKRRSKIRRSLRASQRPKKKGTTPGDTNATVAVKTLKAQATEAEIRDLAAELKLMIHLGEHKNIVNLLGACTTGRRLYVILEFCPHGNLLTFLRGKRDIYSGSWVKEIFDPEKEFTLIDLVGAAFQVAKGMEFLAGKKLIHRDLAARNILVGDEYVMKISDFGLARDVYKDDVYVKTSSGLLPVKWMAVESLFDRVYTHQSDVWSFGVLLWEMMTLGGAPYPNLPAEELLDFLQKGKRMPQPLKCPLEIYTIMRDCWQDEPAQRPTFANLVEHLGRILERHLEKESPYLHLEATPEELEEAKEKDSLMSPKPDYYLQPLLLANKQNKYDASAPLPTPPTDVPTPTYSGTRPPGVDSEPSTSGVNASGSYERLRDDSKGVTFHAPRGSLDNESGIGLDDINSKIRDEAEIDSSKHVETVV